MIYFISTLLFFLFYSVYKHLILPLFFLKKISLKKNFIGNFKIIDVRDSITSYNEPFIGAENIPLSILNREIKKLSLKNEILIVVKNKRQARLATKIFLKKERKNYNFLIV